MKIRAVAIARGEVVPGTWVPPVTLLPVAYGPGIIVNPQSYFSTNDAIDYRAGQCSAGQDNTDGEEIDPESKEIDYPDDPDLEPER